MKEGRREGRGESSMGGTFPLLERGGARGV